MRLTYIADTLFVGCKVPTMLFLHEIESEINIKEMNENELIQKLTEFRNLPAENEIVEFKEAKNDFSFEKIGKYFSALSNEANLKGKMDAWLIFALRIAIEI